MIFVLLFLIIVMGALITGFYIIHPITNLNPGALNNINSNIETVTSFQIKSDLTNTKVSAEKTLDFVNENYSGFNKDKIIEDSWIKDKLWKYSEVEETKIENNNIITNHIVNLHNFSLELQLVPLEDFDYLTLWTNDSVQNIIVQEKVYKLGSYIKTVDWSSKKLELKKYLSNLAKNYSSFPIWNKVYGDVTDNPDLVQFIDWIFYDKKNWTKYNKKIIIKPFYNLDNSWNYIPNNDWSQQFKKWYLYLIKIYFILDPDKLNKLKIYIPNGEYITLNNIVKITEKRQGNKYYFNKIKIIKNWLVNKVEENTYGF